MKKAAAPNYYHYKKRLKKHLKTSKAARKRKRASKLTILDSQVVNYKDSLLLRSFVDSMQASDHFSPRKGMLLVPKKFCIYSEYEETLLFIRRFIKASITNTTGTKLDFRKTVKWSLGSECLLGIIGCEISKLCEKNNTPFSMAGETAKDDDYQDLIDQVGIVSELPDHRFDTPTPSNDQLIHAFKKDCSLTENASISANDLKNETAIGFVDHISNCLKDHKLKLKEKAADGLQACIGELLDNVREHCRLGTPKWHVRAYLNNNSQNKTLEVTVFNIGKSFSETFDLLPDNNFSKKIAEKYVSRHQSKTLTREALLTVAALQGNMSSKNSSDEDTRGHGTITLIETFEKLYKNYSKLRLQDKTPEKNKPIMNLISGTVMVKFDGKYKSQKTNDAGGGERILIPFNEADDLAYKPDSNYIRVMKKAYFPGAMINIKVPLNGSINEI